MRNSYSPIDRLAAEMARPKGTGAEFMTELSKKPGYKQAEVEDRDLQTLMALPKMAREEFLAALKAKGAVKPEEKVLSGSPGSYSYAEQREREMSGQADEDTHAHHEEHTLPGGSNYREILLKHPKGGFPGVNIHYGGEPNVLAGIRVKDRTGPNGEKILHIEEIQSDWHKKGAQHGYAPKGVDMEQEVKQAAAAHRQLAEKLREAKSNSQNAEAVLTSDRPLYQDPEVRQRYMQAKNEHNRDIMDLMPQVMKAEEAHRKAKEMAERSVSDAPFKKNWHELALKRMIQHAAEKGYDSIAITQGADQAKRWGAEGGEKAKGFHDLYDQQMPQFLNKFGKKYGAQVQQGYVNTDDRNGPSQTAMLRASGIPERDWGSIPHAQKEQMLAEYAAKQPPSMAAVHTFPITPEMREDVTKNGIPLYADGGSVGYHPDVQKALTEGRITAREAAWLNPLHSTKGDPTIGSGGVRDGASERQMNYMRNIRSGAAPMPEGWSRTGAPEGWKAPVRSQGLDLSREQLKSMNTAAPRLGGMSEYANTYPAGAGNSNYYRELTQALKENPGYQPYIDEIEQLKQRTPRYKSGGAVEGGEEDDVPRETVKAYKLFRVDKKHPGKLFPLFIGKNEPVGMGKWTPAEHIPTKGFAERPGWHAGDLPMATHIGEKSDTSLTAPDRRPRNQVWTEIEMPNDVDWQTEANKRGTNPHGRVVPVKAHITDQVPTGGHYRYKTNPNMTGSWLIGGSMKVNRVLSDKEVKAINRAAKQADLPRHEPFDPKEFGFAEGGEVKPISHGIIKERVTVSPDKDVMTYELMSAKHFTKKVK